MSLVVPRHSSDLRQGGTTFIRAAVARAENLEQALTGLRRAVTGSESDWGDDNEAEDTWYPHDA
jgi:Flp pilus assembly protein TadD